MFLRTVGLLNRDFDCEECGSSLFIRNSYISNMPIILVVVFLILGSNYFIPKEKILFTGSVLLVLSVVLSCLLTKLVVKCEKR